MVDLDRVVREHMSYILRDVQLAVAEKKAFINYVCPYWATSEQRSSREMAVALELMGLEFGRTRNATLAESFVVKLEGIDLPCIAKRVADMLDVIYPALMRNFRITYGPRKPNLVCNVLQ